MTRIGIVTGMLAEQECLSVAIQTLPSEQRPLLFCAGGDIGRAYTGAQRMIDQGAQGLLSIGIAGGLAHDLSPGDTVLADTVIGHEGRRRETHGPWRLSVEAELAMVRIGAIYASPEAAHTPEHKSALHRQHGAIAVDMESAGVAEAAAGAGTPFLALRIIADPALRAIPSAALHGLGPGGERRPFAVLARLLYQPWELLPLIRVGRDSQTALNRLRGVASLGRALFTPPVV